MHDCAGLARSFSLNSLAVVVAYRNPNTFRVLAHVNSVGFASHLDHTLCRHFRAFFVGSVPSSARKLCRLMIPARFEPMTASVAIINVASCIKTKV
jgi:hypothetical protein